MEKLPNIGIVHKNKILNFLFQKSFAGLWERLCFALREVVLNSLVHNESDALIFLKSLLKKYWYVNLIGINNFKFICSFQRSITQN